MASIEKHGENSYCLVVEAGNEPNGKRIKRTKTVKIEEKFTPKKRKEHLELELAKFKMEVEAGEYLVPEKMAFSTFVDEWRSKYAEKELSPKTLNIYEGHIKNHILPAFGHQKLDEIKPIHLVILLDTSKPGARKDGRSEPLSARTVQYIYAVLQNLFSQAVGWRIIKPNPLQGIKKPKAEKKKAPYYDADEAKAAIEALLQEPLMWRIFILGAILGGFHRGELVALEWPDVLFDQDTIQIRKSIPLMENGKVIEKDPKNGEERTIEMPQWYMDELRRYHLKWREERMEIRDRWEGEDQEYVLHAGLGKPIYFDYPSEWWGKFTKRHGLRHIRLHDLRHSSATLLIEQGASLKAIQERLGHKQHQTTADIYAHVTKKVSRDLADKFDQFDPKKQSI